MSSRQRTELPRWPVRSPSLHVPNVIAQAQLLTIMVAVVSGVLQHLGVSRTL